MGHGVARIGEGGAVAAARCRRRSVLPCTDRRGRRAFGTGRPAARGLAESKSGCATVGAIGLKMHCMKPLLALALIAGGLSSYAAAQTPRDASLKQMYDTHSWFELRDAARGKNLPALYLGAIASAFNRVQDAEKHLNRAIREASNTEAANDARGMLAMLYIRAG